MKKPILSALTAVIAVGAMFSTAASHADNYGSRHYAVTITNITRGQIMAPPAVIAHNGQYELFTLGAPAIPELATLAETGNGAPLLGVAAAMPSVYKTALGSGGIPPGQSQTITIETTREFPEISVAAMLVSTNDGFMAVHGVSVQNRSTVSVEATAYDAGSEMNSEDCSFIPGPPCGDRNHNPAGAEGYVHVHSGIHGISGGALNPAQLDWRNPVARVEIKRLD
jgi:hypothetical protein